MASILVGGGRGEGVRAVDGRSSPSSYRLDEVYLDNCEFLNSLPERNGGWGRSMGSTFHAVAALPE